MPNSFSRKLNDITFWFDDRGDGDDAKRHVTAGHDVQEEIQSAADYFTSQGWDTTVVEDESSTPEEPIFLLSGSRNLKDVLPESRRSSRPRRLRNRPGPCISPPTRTTVI